MVALIRRTLLYIAVLILLPLTLHAATAQLKIDDDLKKLPASYQQRIQQFRNVIRAEKTRDSKVQKALQFAKTPTSPYRKDAIRFLTEVKAVETTPTLIALGKKYPELRDEVVVAMGHFQTKESIDYLIECLIDPDPSGNIRNISIHSLRNLTNQDFEYNSDATPIERNKSYKRWQEWWTANRETFKKVERNSEETQEANEMWDKYGLRYLDKK